MLAEIEFIELVSPIFSVDGWYQAYRYVCVYVPHVCMSVGACGGFRLTGIILKSFLPYSLRQSCFISMVSLANLLALEIPSLAFEAIITG